MSAADISVTGSGSVGAWLSGPLGILTVAQWAPGHPNALKVAFLVYSYTLVLLRTLETPSV